MIVNQQSLRGIYVGFNTLFNKAFEEVTPIYTEVATVTPSTTDSETYAWLGDIPGMREWIGDREIQNLTASDYTIKNKDFELTVGVDRNAIEDDKIGLYNPSVQMLGQSAAAHPDELIFALLAGSTAGGKAWRSRFLFRCCVAYCQLLSSKIVPCVAQDCRGCRRISPLCGYMLPACPPTKHPYRRS